MPQITVFKCPRTGELFEDRYDYLDHLQKMATVNRFKPNKRQARLAHERWFELKKEFRRCGNVEEICEWIGANMGDLIANNPENVAEYGRFCQRKHIGSPIKIESSNQKWETRLSSYNHQTVPGWTFDAIITSDDLDIYGNNNGGRTIGGFQYGITVYGNDLVAMYEAVFKGLGLVDGGVTRVISRREAGHLIRGDNEHSLKACFALPVNIVPVMQMRTVLESEEDVTEQFGKANYG